MGDNWIARIRQSILMLDWTKVLHCDHINYPTICLLVWSITLSLCRFSQVFRRKILVSSPGRLLFFLTSCRDTPKYLFTEFPAIQHSEACQKLSLRMLTDSSHSIYEHLTKSSSYSITCSSWKPSPYDDVQIFYWSYLVRIIKESRNCNIEPLRLYCTVFLFAENVFWLWESRMPAVMDA